MDFDLVVIGSGPGGYVAAIRAAQLGLKVACIEKAELGGICLNWGCIPTKAMLRSAELWAQRTYWSSLGITAQDWRLDFTQVVRRSREVANRLSKGVEFLFKKNQVHLIAGQAAFGDEHTLLIRKPDGGSETVSARFIIIATGARPRFLPGIIPDGKLIITSKEALTLDRVPKSLAVIGAGAIGVEFAYLYRVLGAEVHLIEMLPQILPAEDAEIARELTRAFRKLGVDIHTDTLVKDLLCQDERALLTIETKGQTSNIDADCVLLAIGVQPNTEGLALEKIGVGTERGWIKVNDHYQTAVKHIYAIGDVIGNPCLAHVASAEGIHAVEHITGHDPTPVNYQAIPGCTYCQPQVASVGLTEREASAKGLAVRIGRAYFRANGKAMAMADIEGMVKVLFDAEHKHLLGAHIIGPEATELIPELVTAVTNRLTYQQLRTVIHAHPTLAETLMEALHDAFGEAIHK